MAERGRFIVVEGLEGAGKSTAIATIKRFLAPHVDELIVTREPGGTRVGEAARQLIKTKNPDEPLDPRAELLLFYAARVQLIERVIRPALARGAWVVADRFELSTFAYQGGGRQLDFKMITELSSFCVQNIKPDLTLFLDLSPEEGLKRVIKRGKTDRIEEEAIRFFELVYASYLQHLSSMDSVIMIDASKSLGQVQHLIRRSLEQFMVLHA